MANSKSWVSINETGKIFNMAEKIKWEIVKGKSLWLKFKYKPGFGFPIVLHSPLK